MEGASGVPRGQSLCVVLEPESDTTGGRNQAAQLARCWGSGNMQKVTSVFLGLGRWGPRESRTPWLGSKQPVVVMEEGAPEAWVREVGSLSSF